MLVGCGKARELARTRLRRGALLPLDELTVALV